MTTGHSVETWEFLLKEPLTYVALIIMVLYMSLRLRRLHLLDRVGHRAEHRGHEACMSDAGQAPWMLLVKASAKRSTDLATNVSVNVLVETVFRYRCI